MIALRFLEELEKGRKKKQLYVGTGSPRRETAGVTSRALNGLLVVFPERGRASSSFSTPLSLSFLS